MLTLTTLPRSRWKNGHGSKATIAVGDGWSLSHAWIDADAPFSDFPGVDRTCVLVAGGGFTLTFKTNPAIELPTPGTIQQFMGEWAARARLHAGPCHVVNVMTSRDRYAHTVRVARHLPEQGYAIVLAGSVTSASEVARCGDTLAMPHHGAASADLLVISATFTSLHLG